jgi:hypothetical protein
MKTNEEITFNTIPSLSSLPHHAKKTHASYPSNYQVEWLVEKYHSEYRIFKPVEITIRGELR